MEQRPQHLPFYALVAAMFISISGDALARIAIPWFVLQTTGSAAQTGIVAFVSVTPVIIATFLGGTLVDRSGYRRVSIVADLLSGGTVLLIPLLHVTVGLEFWQLLVLVFLGNLFDAPGASARRAIMPELAEAAGLSLERATAIMDGLNRSTSVVGGILAGVLVATIGAVNTLWLDAASFFIAAGLIAFLVPQSLVAQREDSHGSYLQDTFAGLRFVRTQTLILVFVVQVMITNMLDGASFSVMMPVYIERQFGESGAVQLGLLISTFALAAVLGTVLMGVYGERFPRRRLYIISFMLVSLHFFLFAATPPFWLLLILHTLTGVALGPINPILSATMYERVPTNMRARVFGVTTAGVLVAMPIGVLSAGYLLEWLGLPLTFALAGALYLAIVAILFLVPAMRDMERPVAATAHAGDV